MGRCRGGFSTKIHSLCDSLGNPLRFVLTGGETSEVTKALKLLDLPDIEIKAVLADKGYDADYVIKAIEDMKAEVVIPPKSNRKIIRHYDKDLYKERNIIERMFNKIKNFRRISTRYEKTALSFLSFLHIVGIYLWLK